jgi:hypothetical protein
LPCELVVWIASDSPRIGGPALERQFARTPYAYVPELQAIAD